MAITRSKNKAPTDTIQLGPAELEAANTYLQSKREASASEKLKDAAKKQLLASLGTCNFGLLPDGRRVVRNVEHYPEGDFHRSAYDKTTLIIA